jgi:hypothetical protein
MQGVLLWQQSLSHGVLFEAYLSLVGAHAAPAGQRDWVRVGVWVAVRERGLRRIQHMLKDNPKKP